MAGFISLRCGWIFVYQLAYRSLIDIYHPKYLADISSFYFLANSYLCTTVLVFNLGTTLQIGQLVKPKLILGPLHRAVSTALPKEVVRI